jgi:saxitoxin biosynthesis operon SxtJ-like protein
MNEMVTRRGHETLPGTERSFGLSVGTVLCVIAAALVWRGRPLRGEVIGAIGLALVFFGAVAPAVLKRPRVWWWRGARVVGDFNARILLTILFVVVFVPFGIVWRLIGKDPLERRRTSARRWAPYPSRYRDRQHYSRMY